MPDVYHVEGLRYNLLSIGQLIQKGYRVYMEDNHLMIKDIRPSNQLIEKSANDKQSLVLFEINSRYERKYKYKSFI